MTNEPASAPPDPPGPPASPSTSPPRRRRWIRRIAGTIGLLLAFVVLMVLVFTLVPAPREHLLRTALARVGSDLPGRLVISQTEWPALGRISVAGLVWTEAGDTLAAADSIQVAVSLGALARRDAIVERLMMRGLTLDVPAIQGRFETPRIRDIPDEVRNAPEVPFFRSGSIAGLPSVAVRGIDLDVRRVRASESMVVTDARAIGHVTALAGVAASATLGPLRLRLPAEDAAIEDVRLDIDIATGTISGSGHGFVTSTWPFRFDATTNTSGHVTLLLYEDGGEPPPAGFGVRLDGTLGVADDRLETASFTTTIVTPAPDRMARDPRIALPPALGDVGSVAISITTEIDLRNGLRADATGRFTPNAWLEAGDFVVSRRPNGDLDASLDVTLDQLHLALSHRAVAGADPVSTLDARVRGLGFLDALLSSDVLSGKERPDSIDVATHLSVTGPPTDPEVSLRTRLAGRHAGVVLDSAAVRVDRRRGADWWSLALVADAMGLRADVLADVAPPAALMASVSGSGSGTGTGAPGSRTNALDANTSSPASAAPPTRSPPSGDLATDAGAWRVKLAPVRILDLEVRGRHRIPIPDRRRGLPPDPNLTALPDPLTIDARGVELVGDLGDVTLTTSLTAARGGETTLEMRWPAPPSRVTPPWPADRAMDDPVWAAWQSPPTPGIRVTARLDSLTPDATFDVTGTAILPGPRTWASRLPENAAVLDLGEVRARFDAHGSASDLVARIDLSETAWIDTLFADLRRQDDRAVLDTLGLVVDDVALGARGSVVGEIVDATARLDLGGLSLVRRLAPGLPDSLHVTARSDVAVSGPSSAARVVASTRGSVLAGPLRAPALTSDVTIEGGRLRTALVVTDTVTSIGDVTVDRFRAAYAPTPGATSPTSGRLRVDASGPGVSVTHQAHIDAADTITIDADTLVVVVGERDLRARRPFAIRVSPEAGILEVDSLSLEGSMGTIRANGRSAPDSTTLTARVDVRVPDRPEWIDVPDGLWPGGLTITLDALADGLLALRASLTGLAIGRATPLALSADLRNERGAFTAALTVSDESTSTELAGLDASIPASFTRFPAAFRAVPESLSIAARWSDFPLPITGDPERLRAGYLSGASTGVIPTATGTLQTMDLGDTPELRFDTTIRFPERTELAPYTFVASARVLGRRGGQTIPLRTSVESKLTRGDATVFDLTTRVQHRLVLDDARGPRPVIADSDSILVHVVSSGIRLSELDAFLPDAYALDGAFTFDLDVNGTFARPTFDGHFDTKALSVRLPDGTYATVVGSARLTGTGMAPRLVGSLEVSNAVINIPAEQRTLLPKDGTAMLWDEQAFRLAFHKGPVATAGFGNVGPEPRRLPSPTRSPLELLPKDTVVDVGVRFPGRFWLRGRGLDVELAGALQLALQEGVPTVVGELGPTGGVLVVLGRTFQVQEGRVVFYGQDEFDPTLDLSMTSTLDDVVVTVHMGGTVLEPSLELSSVPEMEEGDIMSLLLFGKRIDDLDTGQTALLESRALDLAQTFAAAQVERAITRELGVDLVRVRQSEDSGSASLVIGKYLSPKALLKYEQEILEGQGASLTLEYQLARRLKLATFLSRYFTSGAEVQWSVDY